MTKTEYFENERRKELPYLEASIMRYDMLFIDTSSVMSPHFARFAVNTIPFLKKHNKRITVCESVLRELKRLRQPSGDSEHLVREVYSYMGLYVLDRFIEHGVVEYVDDGLTEGPADFAFQKMFISLRPKKRLLLIAQDVNLTNTILRFNLDRSVYAEPIGVKQITPMGMLEPRSKLPLPEVTPAQPEPQQSRRESKPQQPAPRYDEPAPRTEPAPQHAQHPRREYRQPEQPKPRRPRYEPEHPRIPRTAPIAPAAPAPCEPTMPTEQPCCAPCEPAPTHAPEVGKIRRPEVGKLRRPAPMTPPALKPEPVQVSPARPEPMVEPEKPVYQPPKTGTIPRPTPGVPPTHAKVDVSDTQPAPAAVFPAPPKPGSIQRPTPMTPPAKPEPIQIPPQPRPAPIQAQSQQPKPAPRPVRATGTTFTARDAKQLPGAELRIPEGFSAVGFIDRPDITMAFLPVGITSICEQAFRDCMKLAHIAIPDTVTAIEASAFSNCRSLQSIRIPPRVRAINNGTFKYCFNLHDVVLNEGLSSIGSIAFKGCNSLTSLYIPSSVIFIGKNAFSSCPKLTIRCAPDSCAWAYALANGIKVEPVE